jgi:stage V sporulation protein G
MKITEIQIIPIKANNGLIAFGSVLFDDCLFLGSIGIHKKLDGSGYRITYPTKKIGDKDINIFHPINKEVSKLIENEIVKKVNRLFA